MSQSTSKIGSQFIGAVYEEHILTDELIFGHIKYPENQRQQCIILCLPEKADELARRRFAREAMIGIEVTRDHENLLTTLQFGHWQDGRLFIAFEYVKGHAVSEKLADVQGDFVAIHSIADGALRALRFLHRRGVAHGSVAAENLLLGNDGIVRLGNFSRARRISERNEAANDLRALGSLLFWLSTGVSVETASDSSIDEYMPLDAPGELILAIAYLLAGSDGSTSDPPSKTS